LWGNGGGSPGVSKAAASWQACRQYVERGVAGVLFSPQ
jgi:hypothetical protein